MNGSSLATCGSPTFRPRSLVKCMQVFLRFVDCCAKASAPMKRWSRYATSESDLRLPTSFCSTSIPLRRATDTVEKLLPKSNPTTLNFVVEN